MLTHFFGFWSMGVDPPSVLLGVLKFFLFTFGLKLPAELLEQFVLLLGLLLPLEHLSRSYGT